MFMFNFVSFSSLYRSLSLSFPLFFVFLLLFGALQKCQLKSVSEKGGVVGVSVQLLCFIRCAACTLFMCFDSDFKLIIIFANRRRAFTRKKKPVSFFPYYLTCI